MAECRPDCQGGGPHCSPWGTTTYISLLLLLLQLWLLLLLLLQPPLLLLHLFILLLHLLLLLPEVWQNGDTVRGVQGQVERWVKHWLWHLDC